MADISTSTWSETAGSNNSAPPNGWPEGQAFSTVNDCAREVMGAVKREYNRSHPTVTAGGTGDILTLTYAVAPTAYVQGMTFRFFTSGNSSLTTTPTINVNGLGAKQIYRLNGTSPLAIGDLVGGALPHEVIYDGTNMRLTMSHGQVTLATQGGMSHANGVIEKWGTSITTLGVGSIAFPVPFPNQCLNVTLQINGGVGTTTLNPLIVGTVDQFGCFVWGDPTQTLGFYYRAIGW